MTQAEIDAIVSDESKRITAAIAWVPDGLHAVRFRVDVESDAGYPLFVQGRVNIAVYTATFVLVHRAVGPPIYRLCIGKDHHNPTCTHVGGDSHVHRWAEATGDQVAEAATGVAGRADDPTSAWASFCSGARLRYTGTLPRLPEQQLGLLS